MEPRAMIIYRRPAPEEAEAFAALHVHCWQESYRGFVPNHLLDAAKPRDRFSMWYDITVNPRRIVIGAFDGKRPIGLAVAGEPHEKILEDENGQLAALYILNSHQRLGIGRELVGHAASTWLAMGGHSMSLSVIAGNLGAIKFYEALGAVFVKDDIYNWDGNQLPTKTYIWPNLAKFAKV